MPAFIDQKALEIARRFAEIHKVKDPQEIARFQLVAAETLKEVYGPYEIIDELEVNERNITTISDVVFHSPLPKERWAPTMDDTGIQLTLARQRRWAADALKDMVRTGRLQPVPVENKQERIQALLYARQVYLDIPHRQDYSQQLEILEEAILREGGTLPCTCLSSLADDAYDAGGPLSGHRRPPPCKAKVHKR